MAKNLNIQNSNELKNQNVSLWKKGKQDIKKYYEVKLKKSTSIKTFLFGILLTVILILPIALLLLQFFKAYIYNLNIVLFVVILALVLLWFCNGLSNYFTIKLTKIYFKEDNKLQGIDEVAVLFYETLNPGFILFTFFILFIFVL
jgi:phosphatidylglycerophosphatase A